MVGRGFVVSGYFTSDSSLFNFNFVAFLFFKEFLFKGLYKSP